MIEKNEVLQLASSLSLSPDTVEKDYVLGWILSGIDKHRALHEQWLFKGGTSLKKCFFETFRFSEDLDFTVTDQAHMNIEFLRATFNEVADQVSEETGIEFSKEMFKFKLIPKEKRFSAQGQIHYNGPLRRRQGVATIKLDLTTDEVVVLKPERKKVHHQYSDNPTNGIWATCYAFEEVVAEKVRALAQRARPRDVYDVVHFFRNRALIKQPKLVFRVLGEKCAYKKISVPTFETVSAHEALDELESQWGNMLAHQLPNLPPLESFWRDIEPFFDWLYESLKEEPLAPVPKLTGTIFQAGRIVNAYSIDAVLQRIQFAAANRVCIELDYHGKSRIVEPLSFRRAKDGNRLFYGFEREAGHPKAYSLSKIQGVTVTNTPYIEKFPVEISTNGAISMPPVRNRGRRR